MRKVIIPSAGNATRFGGTLKELLPINVTETPMLRAIQNAVLGMDADEIVITTKADKIQEHALYVHKHVTYGVPISFRLLAHTNDMWGSILTGLDWDNPTDGGLVMPDTITFVPDVSITAPIMFGTFWTQEPERFSTLQQGTIVTKEKLTSKIVGDYATFETEPYMYKAWGVVIWSKEVAEYWINTDEYAHYDDAFRDAMQRFGYNTFDLPYYYDIGTFRAYKSYLKGTEE